jgi:hypothetical protein
MKTSIGPATPQGYSTSPRPVEEAGSPRLCAEGSSPGEATASAYEAKAFA